MIIKDVATSCISIYHQWNILISCRDIEELWAKARSKKEIRGKDGSPKDMRISMRPPRNIDSRCYWKMRFELGEKGILPPPHPAAHHFLFLPLLPLLPLIRSPSACLASLYPSVCVCKYIHIKFSVNSNTSPHISVMLVDHLVKARQFTFCLTIDPVTIICKIGIVHVSTDSTDKDAGLY